MCANYGKIVLDDVSLNNYVTNLIEFIHMKFGNYDIGTQFEVRQRFVFFIKDQLKNFGNRKYL